MGHLVRLQPLMLFPCVAAHGPLFTDMLTSFWHDQNLC